MSHADPSPFALGEAVTGQVVELPTGRTAEVMGPATWGTRDGKPMTSVRLLPGADDSRLAFAVWSGVVVRLHLT